MTTRRHTDDHLAHSYASGGLGLPQDWSKATELYLQAGELGCAEAYYNLGIASKLGRGIERDLEMARLYSQHQAERRASTNMKLRLDKLVSMSRFRYLYHSSRLQETNLASAEMCK